MKTKITTIYILFISLLGFSQNIEFLEQPIYLNNSIIHRATLLIDLRPGQLEITRPLIVAEGFDAGSVISPEEEYGDTDLISFDRSINNAGSNLRDLIDPTNNNQTYDIIYVNWTNGTDAIQENSLVLKEVINWVNSQKVGNEPNVLLGQSMGGVIGRYTLANMEKNGETHNVRLFVAHDAPMQGANTPLSLQYFSRHAYDQYTAAPVLYGLGEIVIPTVLNLIELMSLGNLDFAFPSISNVLTLQDTPAAMQMNYHYVDRNSNPTMTVHNAWQQELDNVGYPSQSRNIAISNGNECAVDHGFDPRAKFINLHDTHNPGFWGDLLHMIATPISGILINDLELTFLGLLPGSSKYFFDFDLHANPAVNHSNRRVYRGKMRYEKKLLWLIPISHTITERTKNAPNGYLPFDTYSGGYYDIVDNIPFDFQQYLPSGTVVNPRYGFIPVVSALDIKRNNGHVNPTDYLKNYSGGTTPEPALTSGFDNFIVDFMPNIPTNNEHISFQPRNGNWLANELDEATNLIEDCSFVCESTSIVGSDNLCNSGGTYSINSSVTPNWSITQGNSLVNLSLNGNSVILTPTNSNASGMVTLRAFLSRAGCGQRTITKQIWIGKPKISFVITSNFNYVRVRMIAENGSDIDQQGITSTSWRTLSSNGGCHGSFSGNGFHALGHGNCMNWSVDTKITATNVCGTTTVYRSFTPDYITPCNDTYKIQKSSRTRDTYKIIPHTCRNPKGRTRSKFNLNSKQTQNVEVFNHYGRLVYTTRQREFDLSFLRKGIYIIKAHVNGEIITHKFIKK